MDRLQALLRIVQSQLQQLPLVEAGQRVRQWLYQQRKRLGWSLLILLMFQLLLGRMRLVTLEGEALGTHYKIQYFDRWRKNYRKEIEGLLGQIEQALSTALPGSELSQFNGHDCTEFYFKSHFFYPVFAKSKEVYRNTAGVFDPTILPLMNAGENDSVKPSDLDPQQIDQLHEYVSLDYVVANEQRIKRLKEGVRLDFGGMLKGYAADQVAKLLCDQGIDRAWIVLGNELVVRGRYSKRKYWSTPIHSYIPALAEEEWKIKVKLMDKAVAISSRQPKEHSERIVDPAPGVSTKNRLLAAVVVAPDCMSADAYATAMMVRGLAYAQELLEKQKKLAAFLVYEDESGAPAFYASPDLMVEEKQNHITLTLAQKGG